MTGRADDQWLSRSETCLANRIRRARMTEIDHDFASVDLLRQVIALIESRDDNGIRPFSRGRDRLSHAAFRSDEKNANPIHLQALPSKASRVVRKRAAFASVISHSGNRHSADILPRQASAVFVGTGFGSINKSLKCDKNLPVHFARRFHIARAKRLDQRADFRRKKIRSDADHSDRADRHERQGQRIVAAQDGKRLRQTPRKSLTRSTLPLASLIETMFRHSPPAATRSPAPISTPHRPGIL